MNNLAPFGPARIFGPSPQTETAIRQAAREHLLARFAPGDYSGAKAANELVQHQFHFYQNASASLLRNSPLPHLLP